MPLSFSCPSLYVQGISRPQGARRERSQKHTVKERAVGFDDVVSFDRLTTLGSRILPLDRIRVLSTLSHGGSLRSALGQNLQILVLYSGATRSVR